MGMSIWTGKETVEQTLALAYGLEGGLADVYGSLAEGTHEDAAAETFSRLSRMERGHQHRLWDLYTVLVSSAGSRTAFEAQTQSRFMEGGFTTEEFLSAQRALDTLSEVIDLAMMLETQALDLYLRASRKAGTDESRKLLYELAEDEKAHLKALGRLMEQQLNDGRNLP
jgi:rubrerythrin